MKKFLITLSLCLSLFAGTANAGIILFAGGTATLTADAIYNWGGVSVAGFIAIPTMIAGALVIPFGVMGLPSTAGKVLIVLDEDGGVKRHSLENLDEAAISVIQEAIEQNYSDKEVLALVEELSN